MSIRSVPLLVSLLLLTGFRTVEPPPMPPEVVRPKHFVVPMPKIYWLSWNYPPGFSNVVFEVWRADQPGGQWAIFTNVQAHALTVGPGFYWVRARDTNWDVASAFSRAQ